MDVILYKNVTDLQKRVSKIEPVTNEEYKTLSPGNKAAVYYKYNSSSNAIEEGSSPNFRCRKIPVADWMKYVYFYVKSTTGLVSATAIFCAFTDKNDSFISRSPFRIGRYCLEIPSNAGYIYINFFGYSFVESYTILSRQSVVEYATESDGNNSFYYKYTSDTNSIDQVTYGSFKSRKIPVEYWMKSVSFEVKSVSGLSGSTTIFCAFSDKNDAFIGRSYVRVGRHRLNIPDNAGYIYINFFGSTFIDYYTISDTRENKFNGMNGVAFGTSLTARAATNYGYLQYLPDLSGMEFDNQGIGSSTILGGDDLNMLSAIKSYSKYGSKDVCVLEGFVNDWYMNRSLGTWKDTGETTVCGCVRSAIKYIMSQNANISIFLVLDHYGRDYNSIDCSSTATNTASLTQIEFYDEVAKVAESLGIPVIKQYNQSQISEDTPQYLSDNIHPSEMGAEQSGNCIWMAMKQYAPNVTIQMIR